jgi:competence protein ComGC
MIRKYIIQEKNSYLKKVLVLIITLIIILLVSVLRIVKAKNLEYYRKQEKLMRLATINYFKDYPSYLPLKNGESKKVIVSSLVKEGYIEKITDINNNECDSMKSYVKVVKNSKDTYTYSSYLVCPNYKVKK